MKVLVTGANGFLGRRVVERLAELGHAVRAMVRAGAALPPEWGPQVEVVRADLRVDDRLAAAFEGIDRDAAVESRPAHAAQAVVERVLDERVCEPDCVIVRSAADQLRERPGRTARIHCAAAAAAGDISN